MGCGARRFGDIGVDLSLRPLACKSIARPGRANVLATVEALPFRDDSFEVVHFLGLLHHLKKPGVAWSEMVRVCGGILVGVEPSFLDLTSWLDKYHVVRGYHRRQLLSIVKEGVSYVTVHWTVGLVPFPRLDFDIVAFKSKVLL